ncbi:MAG: metallophosphoesterase family protein [Deltaproteobacteria bacterium]|nr:metallophosphoesterase family protein [Deltaproteobacteria bacterium]
MLYAIISDIHSNLEALDSVLDKIKGLKVEEIICLGDVVGYGANPNECISVLKKHNVRCIAGNHDTRATGQKEPDSFNPKAQVSVFWTRENIDIESLAYLSKLPESIIINEEVIAFHGQIDSTDDYLLSMEDVRINFSLLDDMAPLKILLYGHTHKPAIHERTKSGMIEEKCTLACTLSNDRSYLINPGSVGQPRDHDPRASFITLDSSTLKIEHHRVTYDIKSCADKIIEAGLPESLGERLKEGR